MKILIVEDDTTIRGELKTFLESYNYEVIAAEDFSDIPSMALGLAPALILLDLGLPMFDGYHIVREIRKESAVPIIIVTSRNTDIDELMSMNLGADDFVTKPYNTQILLARIESLLKRSYGNQGGSVLQVNDVSLNLGDSTVRVGDEVIELTKNELRILNLLMKNQGTIISRDDIMTELWQSDEFVDDNTLTVNINRLRKKLEEVGVKDFIQTKRGQGYLV